MLVTKIKKLKNCQKEEHSTKDIEGKFLDKKEENSCIRNHNEDLILWRNLRSLKMIENRK